MNDWHRIFAWLPISTDSGTSWCGGTPSRSTVRWLRGLRWLCFVECRRIEVRNYLWNTTDVLWDFRVIPDYTPTAKQ